MFWLDQRALQFETTLLPLAKSQEQAIHLFIHEMCKSLSCIAHLTTQLLRC